MLFTMHVNIFILGAVVRNSINVLSMFSKGPVTRCNFPGNLQRNSTLKRCKLVTNV